eukprot:gb/GEZN01005634.1/.p1 GENE.gb/GEZN01005634.1/~~gb/GEZN01005634.1/.p1  ORF type:complete len:414 (-),score=56.16 gb/GEZN01005634.1/:446-1687(-)
MPNFLSRVSMSSGSVITPKMTSVVFGKALVPELPLQLKVLDRSRALVMASSTLHEETHAIQDTIKALGDKFGALYVGMRPHTPREDVLDAAKLAEENDCDVVVTIGGGSLTDGGKGVCLAVEQGIKSVEQFEQFSIRNLALFEAPHFTHTGKIQQIAVPTTLSAGEFNSIAEITNLSIPTPIKQSFVHPLLQPQIVLLDPEITQYTPQWLFLSSGVRAIDHCVEALCSVNNHYYSNGIATAALTLLIEGLTRVKKDPTDMDARLKCMVGCWMACSSIDMKVDFGASHAIGHVLGGAFNVPHGHTSCVTLPYVLDWNSDAIPNRELNISRIFGNEDRSIAAVFKDFVASLDLPTTLPEVGVKKDQLEEIAKAVMGEVWAYTNPKTIESSEDILEILENAYTGELRGDAYAVGSA